MPQEYTCEGSSTSPPLQISGIPEGAHSLAIIVEDPDAPGRVFDHWVIWNIPPGETIEAGSVPGIRGVNGKGELGYRGPCPPTGTHRYFFKVFAVDTLIDLPEGSNKLALESALQHHTLAYGELIGLYKKKNV
jgi:Raf kinase inhibitor-like YbhB/YbcL family protein